MKINKLDECLDTDCSEPVYAKLIIDDVNHADIVVLLFCKKHWEDFVLREARGIVSK